MKWEGRWKYGCREYDCTPFQGCSLIRNETLKRRLTEGDAVWGSWMLRSCPQQEHETGKQTGELSYNNPSLAWPVSKATRLRTQAAPLLQTGQVMLLKVRKHSQIPIRKINKEIKKKWNALLTSAHQDCPDTLQKNIRVFLLYKRNKGFSNTSGQCSLLNIACLAICPRGTFSLCTTVQSHVIATCLQHIFRTWNRNLVVFSSNIWLDNGRFGALPTFTLITC